MSLAGEAGRLEALHDYVDVDEPAPPELDAIVRLAAAVSGVPTATVNLIDERLARQVSTIGFDRAVCAREDSMCTISLALGGFVHTEDASLDPRFNRGSWIDLGIRFYAAAPLMTPEGYSLGSLCVFDTVAGKITAEQENALTDLAAVVVALFDRTRKARREAGLEAEAERSRVLQEWLLPPRLPGFDRVQVASRYLPGTLGAEVGGDWYDAVRTDTSLVFCIGDVQGHNARASALMGQLRSAVRAYVSEGHSPGAALERTNLLLLGLESDLLATCCLLELDERTGDVSVATAGHPVPLVLGPDGQVSSLHADPGPPLGVQADAEYAVSRHALRHPSRVLMFTDGLDELRGSGNAPDISMVLAAGVHSAPEELADRILALASPAVTDDVALLLLDYAGPAAECLEDRLELAPDMRAVAEARAHLRSVLGEWSLRDVSDLAELVVSELVTNALLHTGSPAVLLLRYELGETCVSVGVEDSSTRHPQPRESGEDATTGRGMHIVDAVAERWWVTPRGDGKTVWADLVVA